MSANKVDVCQSCQGVVIALNAEFDLDLRFVPDGETVLLVAGKKTDKNTQNRLLALASEKLSQLGCCVGAIRVNGFTVRQKNPINHPDDPLTQFSPSVGLFSNTGD